MKKIHYCMVDRDGIECLARVMFRENLDIMPDPAEITDCLIEQLDSEFFGNICFFAGNNDNIDYLSKDFDAVVECFECYFTGIAEFFNVFCPKHIFNCYLFHGYIPE